MIKSSASFTFVSKNADFGLDSFVAVIPSSVSTEGELLSVYAQALRFPDYFGYNWDALEECLRDFHWLENHRIVILHSSFPLELQEADTRVYLDILDNCVKSWKPGEEHELIVAFPIESQEAVNRFLKP